ncbi:hypothetical protein ACQVTS_32065 [Bacillus mycoides]|uniref:hypothetical protein n=1 Tax=Bacillus mycoides TaxID=1405 RepID=UPI003D661278
MATKGRRVFKMTKNTEHELDYVFIEGEGTWFFSKEDANKAHYKTGNEVGLYYKEKEVDGVLMYRQCESNVWD